jgi:peptidoglycan hydrolase-like protein with peptidoglycan-binding domain
MKTSKLAFGVMFVCLLMLGAGPMVFGGPQAVLAADQTAQTAEDLQTAPNPAPEAPEAMQPAAKPAAEAAQKAASETAETMKPAAEKAMKHHDMKHHKKMMHMAMSTEKVKAVQSALNKAGYSLKEDGVMGKKTHMALKEYQKANNLKVTGKVNKATLKKLGII